MVSVEQGGLKLEKDEMVRLINNNTYFLSSHKINSLIFLEQEFAHPFFLRGNEASLELIKRKVLKME